MTQFLKTTTAAFALFILSCVFALPLKAEDAGQCALDHSLSTDTQNYSQCPIDDTNDAIIKGGFNGVRLDASTTLSITPIYAHGVCQYVDNNSGTPLFIPLKTSEEWAAFLARPPAGLHFAGCCLPRPMRVSDVPVPQNTCTGGWTFKGIVDSSDHTNVIAIPVSKSGDAGFVLADNQGEDTSYPVLKLPIQRDDIAAVLPDNSNPAKTYTAQYTCAGQDDAFLNFHMQCGGTKWSTTSASGDEETTTPAVADEEVVATTTTETTTSNRKTADVTTTADSCPRSSIRSYTKGCPNGASGSITYRDVFNSCTKQIETQIVNQTCGTISGGTTGCTATSSTRTTTCPTNPSGSITIVTSHICDGTNNGAGRDNVTTTRQNCPVGGTTGGTCTPSSNTNTQTCPTNPAGTITTVTSHICDGSNNGAGRDQIMVTRRNCSTGGTTGCIASSNTSTQTCPTNPSGTISTITAHICDGSNNGAGRDSITQTRQNCPVGGTTGCTATSNTQTSTCPTNPAGTITVVTRHICDGSNNGAGRDSVDTTRQNCPVGGTTGCIPGSSTSTAACPSGQTGAITTVTRHICDGSNNGAGSTNTQTNSTCQPAGGTFTCTPTNVLTTTPCPEPNGGGIITLRRIRVCDGRNNGAGTTTETVFQNNCVPAGCIKTTILKTSTVCPGGMLTTAKVYDTCTKQVSIETISNTCSSN